MASAMAAEGLIVFVSTHTPFLTRRAYEQILIDCCLSRCSVKFLGYGGGVVYAPLGPTHWSLDDFALLRSLPHMQIFAPADAREMDQLISKVAFSSGPAFIRMARGEDPFIPDLPFFEIGKAHFVRHGKKGCFLSTGIMTQQALLAADLLAQKDLQMSVAHISTIRPLDEAFLKQASCHFDFFVTIEEHYLDGGLGSAVLESFNKMGIFGKRVLRLGFLPSFTPHYSSQEEILSKNGLNAEGIAFSCLSFWREQCLKA
jgi:transketolase